MFQLYKSRDFGAFFQDTFAFLRLHGKHFFKNFIIVNGFFMIIIVTLTYYFYKFYQDTVLNSLVLNQNGDAIADYFNENLGTVILFGSIGFFIFIIASIFNYAFTPIYFKLYDRHRGANFESKEIFDELKANIEKIIIYIFASIPVGFLAMIVVFILTFILAITIIGIPLILFVIAVFTMFFHAALLEYLNTDKGVFECFGYGLNMCFQKFFPAMGAIAVFFIMIYVLQLAVGIVQFIITSILGITTLSDPSSFETVTDTSSFQFVVLFIFQIFSYLFGLLTSAISQVNQAVIYYSLKEERENIHTKSTIDEIGSGQ